MPIADPFGGQRTVTGPADDVADVSPSDTKDLSFLPRFLYVGVGGDVAIMTKAGTSAVFKNVPAGGYVMARSLRVLQTGTTASSILACA